MIDAGNIVATLCLEWHDEYKREPDSCLFVGGIFVGRIASYYNPSHPSERFIAAWAHDNTGTGTCAGIYPTADEARAGLLWSLVGRMIRGEKGG